MNYYELFNTIKTTGSSKANRSKYNLQLRNSGWSESEVKTARACYSESLQCLASHEKDPNVILAYQSFLSGDKEIYKDVEEKHDFVDVPDTVDNKALTKEIIKFLEELKLVYISLGKEVDSLDQTLNHLR